MKLAVTKYGAFYLAPRVAFVTRKVGRKNVISAVLSDALFIRRAKAISSYHLVYIPKKSLAKVVDLPAEFDSLDLSVPDVLYNRLLSFVLASDFKLYLKRLPEPILIDSDRLGGGVI